MRIYAILEGVIDYDITIDKMSFSKEEILLEINYIIKYGTKRNTFYLGVTDLDRDEICEVNHDFILLESWTPTFNRNKWIHKVYNES